VSQTQHIYHKHGGGGGEGFQRQRYLKLQLYSQAAVAFKAVLVPVMRRNYTKRTEFS